MFKFPSDAFNGFGFFYLSVHQARPGSEPAAVDARVTQDGDAAMTRRVTVPLHVAVLTTRTQKQKQNNKNKLKTNTD
jgi:hypothetical protein